VTGSPPRDALADPDPCPGTPHRGHTRDDEPCPRRRRHPPPASPIDDPRPVVTAAELTRLAGLRRHRTWHDLATASDATSFLLDLVDRLLGRALLPGEDPYAYEVSGDRWSVVSGPSLYVCGHGEWYVRLVGRPGIVTSFTANVHDAARLRAALNGRDPTALPRGSR
jgi:hypothetical protein